MKISIIGASHAGIACATRARREYPDAEIVMYDRRSQVSFISQNILFYLLNEDKRFLKEGAYTDVVALESLGITMQMEVEVLSVDVASKSLTYIKDRQSATETFDKLVLATGSTPILPAIPYENLENIFVLKSVNDALAINDWISKKKKAVVLGGGSIGVEIASVLQQRGVKVSILSYADRLMEEYLDVEASEFLNDYLAEKEINVVFHDSIRSIEHHRKRLAVETRLEDSFMTDGVIFTIGFAPNVTLLEGQVEMGPVGTIAVDQYMRTSVPDVFAVGDSVAAYDSLEDQSVYRPLASTTIREGEIAALNLVEPKRKMNSTQGAFCLDLGEIKVCSVGLTLGRALKIGKAADLVYCENAFHDELGYKIWMVYEKGTHRILGVQVITSVDSSREYVNIFSLAIEHGDTVENLEFTDFYLEHGFANPKGFNKLLAAEVALKEK